MNELQCLMKFYEHHQDAVYIVEEESRKLVYINQAGCRLHHLTSSADYIGKPSREVIGDRADMIDGCEAERDRFTTKEIAAYHDVKRVQCSLFASDGTLYRIGMIEEFPLEVRKKIISSQKMHEKIIDQALQLAMNEEDPEESLRHLLSYVGRYMHCERAYIYEQRPDGTFARTYDWEAEGMAELPEDLQTVPYEGVIDTWYQEFDRHENILIDDPEVYRKENEAMYRLLQKAHVRTLAAGPLMLNHRRIGFYGVDNPAAEDLESVSLLFDILEHFISAMIRQREFVRSMYHDALTGVYNRAYLNEYLKKKRPARNITFLFVDINNLKKINDTRGHVSGDELICRTAHLFADFVAPHPVFRMGGDEFLALCPGYTEAQSEEMEHQLHLYFEHNGISAAIGRVWRVADITSFTDLFAEADQKMYNNKLHMHEQMEAG